MSWPVPWWLPLAAFAVDALVGDPRWLTHPVVYMGRAITRLEALLRRTGCPLKAAGVVLALTLPAAAWVITWAIIALAARLHPWLGVAAAVWLFATCLAARSLAEHALAVLRPLAAGDLTAARQQLSFIVGRDTAPLDEAQIARAAVETVAESSSDGVIAPLFWGLVGGAPLAMAYKAVNTLDSMVGHKDARYIDFGWASARLDDLVNLIPARLSALLIGLAGGSARALAIAWRDGMRHPSPNSGWPEAAMAGLLGVQLGGVNFYDGEPEERPRMGDPLRPLVGADIAWAVRVVWLASGLATALGAALLWWAAPA